MEGGHNTLSIKLQQAFTELLHSIDINDNEITIIVSAQDILHVMSQLCVAPEFKFEQLIDLAGVDYLEFGVDEWDTETATSSGFSRGVGKSIICTLYL